MGRGREAPARPPPDTININGVSSGLLKVPGSPEPALPTHFNRLILATQGTRPAGAVHGGPGGRSRTGTEGTPKTCQDLTAHTSAFVHRGCTRSPRTRSQRTVLAPNGFRTERFPRKPKDVVDTGGQGMPEGEGERPPAPGVEWPRATLIASCTTAACLNFGRGKALRPPDPPGSAARGSAQNLRRRLVDEFVASGIEPCGEHGAGHRSLVPGRSAVGSVSPSGTG